MTDLFQEPDGATPLDPEMRDGLLQTWITNRNDLNEAEQENIVKGVAWARRRRGADTSDLLSDDFSKALHKQMFGEVWKWAGTPRQREVMIEATIPPQQIAVETVMLFDNVRYWLDHDTYAHDEIATRFHHRLTQNSSGVSTTRRNPVSSGTSPWGVKICTPSKKLALLAVQLNGQYHGEATGETFNHTGQTDILIRYGMCNV
jgi:hypothetical protein